MLYAITLSSAIGLRLMTTLSVVLAILRLTSVTSPIAPAVLITFFYHEDHEALTEHERASMASGVPSTAGIFESIINYADAVRTIQ